MLTDELMKKVRQLEIRTRRSVSEVFSGEYSSAFRGRGMEFSEVREYQPGDDIRVIDWNVTARMGSPFVKRYVEERELTVMLAVDLSGSGRFGSIDRIKNETAAELCAVLAFAATRNNDKVGLLIFTGRVELFIPPKKGLRHVLRLIRELLDFEPGPASHGTDIAVALEHLGRVLRRRAVVFLVSDFIIPAGGRLGGPSPGGLALPGKVENALRLLGRRHDVITARVADPRERELPRAGLVELEDSETGERFVLDTSSARVRAQFERLARERGEAIEKQMRRIGVDQMTLTTHEPYLQTLFNLFRRRERRR